MSITITDMFCGAGGSSLGATMAGASGRLALNHWSRAIETHNTNFPDMDHDCADVSALTTAQIYRYPSSDILLASPECTNHSPAKGAKRRKPKAASLFDDGPAGDDEQDRSRATMWDVWRFAEAKATQGHPYKAIIVENVVEAYKWGPDDNGALFQAWLAAGQALGYEFEIVWLNSMFSGGVVPQSRDRMYVVWWRKEMRRPNLKVTPPSWCPSCEKIVLGEQVWKKLDYIWGRYGAQYYYKCPEPGCPATVYPGAWPASTIIDWTLPAERIGDRNKPLADSTRGRIKRGLERIFSEPFAVRLLHGKSPKPLTLPIATLTTRHDMAMAIPVAGNTFERSPGNRARRTDQQPLPTVHGTAEQAMVMNPMGGRTMKPADEAAIPTQSTTARAAIVTAGGKWPAQPVRDDEPIRTITRRESEAIVMANRSNNVPDSADSPAPPVLTGGHLAAIMRNNTGGGGMVTPDHEPVRALTSKGHQSVLVPYNQGNESKVPDTEPTPTLTTRDRVGLVVPFTRNGRAREIDTDHVPTMATQGPPAVVEVTDDDIDDCRFRMFDIPEIAGAMAIVDHADGNPYVVTGNKREQMAQYGAAVTPPAMELLVGRVLEVIQ